MCGTDRSKEGCRVNYLREKLKEIEELSIRKEVREIYQSVFTELAKYQDEQMKRLEEQVWRSIQPVAVDYGIDLFLTTHEDSRKWEDVCSCVDKTCRYPWKWEQRQISRVYLDITKEQQAYLEHHEREFKACVKTNYETYSCKVALEPSLTGVDFICKINEIMESNGIDLPQVSDCYAKRFMDVVYTEQKDRLRAEETIEAIEIDWEELTPYIKENVVLLSNVKPCNGKERVFPVPEQNALRYKHELLLQNKECAYLVDVTKYQDYEIIREEQILGIKTTQKQYQNWIMYEIVPPYEWKRAWEPEGIISNRIKASISESIQTYRKNTKAERYRRIGSYEAAAVFTHYEVQEKEIVFYAQKVTYLEEACVDLIMKDLKEQYCGLEIKGRIVKESRGQT